MNKFGTTTTFSNEDYSVTIAPEMGLSLVDFQYQGVQILAQHSEPEFFSIKKGLGPIIVPHFNQFAATPDVDTSVFSHVAGLKAMNVEHPFQHGIGRYVPWSYSTEGNNIKGTIDSSMKVHGYTYGELTGYEFSAAITYTLETDGLKIDFDLKGEKPVAGGIHFYYDLYAPGSSRVFLPEGLALDKVELNQEFNRAFPLPATGPSPTSCTLQTDKYVLETLFSRGPAIENSFDTIIIFHPDKSNLVCVEPISYNVQEENQKHAFQGTIWLKVRKEL